MWTVFLRQMLAQALHNPAVKAHVIGALRTAAARTDTKLDDSAVDLVEGSWDAIVSAITG
jgi:hypothetical protein